MNFTDEELLFLTQFRKPISLKDLDEDFWLNFLKRHMESIVRDFCMNDLIFVSDVIEKLCYTYKQNELVELCKKNNCNYKGNKSKLAKNLVEKQPEYWTKKLEDLVLYKLSDKGLKVAEIFTKEFTQKA